MRIGIVTGEYPPMQGGIGAYTQILAHEMQSQGAAIFILSNRQATSVDPPVALANPIHTWGVGSLRTIQHWAVQNQVDVINIQFQTAAYGMSPWIHFVPEMTPLPVVTTFHDLRHPYLFPKAGGLRDWVVMHLARRSAGVIVTNHEDYARIDFVQNKSLIPIGSNIRQRLPDDFPATQWRSRAGAAPSDFLIAYFGLFNQSKGLETLFESAAELRASGVAVRVVMVGGGLGSSDPTNAAYLTSLHAKIDALGISDHIHWTGYLESEAEVGAYLAASDVVALPFADGASFRRGSLMAAIQYGCAIVSTTPTIVVPAFQSGVNMLLAERGSRAALTRALDAVRQSPDLRARLRSGAVELRQQFAWPEIARDTIRFFEQVRR